MSYNKMSQTCGALRARCPPRPPATASLHRPQSWAPSNVEMFDKTEIWSWIFHLGQDVILAGLLSPDDSFTPENVGPQGLVNPVSPHDVIGVVCVQILKVGILISSLCLITDHCTCQVL